MSTHTDDELAAMEVLRAKYHATAKKTHTPGPWHVDEQPNDLVRIIGGVDGDTYDDGSPRMIYTHVCDVIDNEDEQANARLIAAAPDLLAAAKDVIAKAATIGPQFLADDLAPLRAAIAKAEPHAPSIKEQMGKV